jgi:hypothetical protein
MRGARGAATLLLAALAACGVKSAPLAPELVEPEAPETLLAAPVPDGVRLTWVRPLHYAGGRRMNDLGGFAIERAPGEGAAPEFERVGTVEVADQDRFRKDRRMEWIDRDVEAGVRYLYRVSAYTLDDYWSPPAGPVAARAGAAPAAQKESRQ